MPQRIAALPTASAASWHALAGPDAPGALAEASLPASPGYEVVLLHAGSANAGIRQATLRQATLRQPKLRMPMFSPQLRHAPLASGAAVREEEIDHVGPECRAE